MIINPVTIRSTLKARGAHAANFSIMTVSPSVEAPNSYRVAALRERISPEEIGDVSQSSEGIMPPAKCMRRRFRPPPTMIRRGAVDHRNKAKGRENIPARYHLRLNQRAVL
jgi:hypothetical protein